MSIFAGLLGGVGEAVAQAAHSGELKVIAWHHPAFTAVLISALIVSALLAWLLWRHDRQLRQTKAHLERQLDERKRLVEHLPVGLYKLIDTGDKFPVVAEMTDRALELLGVERSAIEEYIYTAFRNAHPDDRERIQQLNDKARRDGDPFIADARYEVNGRQRWLRLESWPRRLDGHTEWSGYIADVTDHHEAESLFETLFEQSPLAIYVHDAEHGDILQANAAAWKIYGLNSLEELTDRHIWQNRNHSEGPTYSKQHALDKIHAAAREGPQRFEWAEKNIDGQKIWVDASLVAVNLGGRSCVLSVCQDVTERHNAEERLRDSEARFRRVLQDIDGVAVQGYGPDGAVNYWNKASEVLYGYSEAEALDSNLLDLIIPPEMRDDVRENLQNVAEGGDIGNGELELMRKDGSLVPVYSSHTVLRPPDAPIELFCIDIDLSERKAHEETLSRLANYDSLTGLPNRRLMSELIEQMMSRARRTQEPFALCYLDLDDFKPINDQYGHGAGDEVLVAIARRLRRLVRGSDLVARLGGDEFVLVLEGIGNGPELGKRLDFLLEGVARPIQLDTSEVVVQVYGSIGATLYPKDDGDPDSLLRHADQAMYRAKKQGRNRYSLFDIELEANEQRRRSRLAEIESGLDNDQFRLHYQPKVELASGDVVGLEALVRWHLPDGQVLSPMAFLPMLDGSDLENRFGEAMIAQALGQIATWSSSGLKLSVSVNISGPHLLSAGFVDSMARLLKEHPNSPPDQLVIEIVESAAVNDMARAVSVLQEIRKLGIEVSLDDFGTGYSSLSHLRSLPVDEVKIDQTFVRDMLEDINDRNIVRSVISLADAFNLRVVAEGVETEQHIAALRELGCGIAQGYAFARPMPAEEISDWLHDRN